MKKLLIAFLSLASVFAHAGALDYQFIRWNATNTLTNTFIPPHPLTPGVFLYNVTTSQAEWATLSSCLDYSSGVLSVATNCVPVNADWNATSGRAQILNMPGWAFTFTGSYNSLGGLPTLGTASPLDVAPSGDASTSQVVKGDDTRLTNTRLPSGETSVGAALRMASDAAAARAAIGAGPGAGTVTSIGITSSNLTITGSPVTGAGSIAVSMPNTGTAGTYSGVTTDALGRVTAGTSRSFSYTTRGLNSCFQISATRDALVTYSVDIQTSLSLVAGQQGTVYLEIFTNSGCSAGTQEVTRFVNGQTGTLTIGLALQQNVTGTLTGVIPAGSYLRLRTENNTGTPTFTARPGQETLL